MNKLNLKAGFTLVELIAVVAVIAILVGIVVPRVGDLRQNANNAKNSANLALVQGAFERAKVSGLYDSAYPSTASAMVAELKSEGYLSDIPTFVGKTLGPDTITASTLFNLQ